MTIRLMKLFPDWAAKMDRIVRSPDYWKPACDQCKPVPFCACIAVEKLAGEFLDKMAKQRDPFEAAAPKLFSGGGTSTQERKIIK